jgi:hypothetical protein
VIATIADWGHEYLTYFKRLAECVQTSLAMEHERIPACENLPTCSTRHAGLRGGVATAAAGIGSALLT